MCSIVMFMFLLFVFFFKQKTAYEMRISDWSSDVCSSDLKRNAAMFARPESRDEADAFVDTRIATVAACLEDLARLRAHGRFCVKEQQIGRASCRERVCQYV